MPAELCLLCTEIPPLGAVLAGVTSCGLFGACILFLRPGNTFCSVCAEPATFLVFAGSFCYELELPTALCSRLFLTHTSVGELVNIVDVSRGGVQK